MSDDGEGNADRITPADATFDGPQFSEHSLGQYKARLVRVVDGDTMYVDAALGFGLRALWDLRFKGVDTAEIFGVSKDSDEYQAGIQHKTFVEEWIADSPLPEDGYPFLVLTNETGKYGRKIALVKRRADGEVLNEALLDEFGESLFYPYDFSPPQADAHERHEPGAKTALCATLTDKL